jgi:hypothetical protein
VNSIEFGILGKSPVNLFSIRHIDSPIFRQARGSLKAGRLWKKILRNPLYKNKAQRKTDHLVMRLKLAAGNWNGNIEFGFIPQKTGDLRREKIF